VARCSRRAHGEEVAGGVLDGAGGFGHALAAADAAAAHKEQRLHHAIGRLQHLLTRRVVTLGGAGQKVRQQRRRHGGKRLVLHQLGPQVAEQGGRGGRGLVHAAMLKTARSRIGPQCGLLA
jgi:hypothetical protein